MTTQNRRTVDRYIVVENAGYEDERDVAWCDTIKEARQWLNKTYDEDDRAHLHPDICLERADGSRTYEI